MFGIGYLTDSVQSKLESVKKSSFSSSVILMCVFM